MLISLEVEYMIAEKIIQYAKNPNTKIKMNTGTNRAYHSSLVKSAAVFKTWIAYDIFLAKQSIIKRDNPPKLQNT